MPVRMLVLFVVAAFGSANAAPPRAECDLDGSQREMTTCADRRLQRADAEMNRLYERQLQRLGEKNRNRLRQSHRAWLSYRDKTCVYEAGLREESGSLWPMQDALCRADLTTQRSRSLQAYIACTQGGCPD